MLPVILTICLPLGVPGNATIRNTVAGNELVLTTTDRLAGAVHSIRWKGQELIDSTDHGRQLQSACSFDCGQPRFWAEAFNPTEAGSRHDGTGSRSTSRLLSMNRTATSLETLTQMAFWLRPGEKSSDFPARNTSPISRHLLRKKISLSSAGKAHLISYEATFIVPPDEFHTLGQFEVVTGYLPPEFGTFEAFDPSTGKLQPVTDGPGEQSLPLVFSTQSGSHAMGILSHESPSQMLGPGYGRWRFAAEKVVKWNLVYRLKNIRGIAAGKYAYASWVVVGSREDVRQAFVQLHTTQSSGQRVSVLPNLRVATPDGFQWEYRFHLPLGCSCD